MVGYSLDIGINLAVEHINDAGGIDRERWVVGNHNNSIAFFVNGFEFFHDNIRRTRV